MVWDENKPAEEEFSYIHNVYMHTSMDKDAFCRDFKSPATIACEVDLNFIRAVLQRTDRSFHEKGDDDLVKTSTSTQRNRALHHFSLMIDTASVDLKKRIFVLSTMILEQFEEERKNAILAVKALRLLPDDLSLVIVGKPTPYAEKLKRYVAANGLKRRVMFLHNVPADDMPAIYQMAEACVYPSRYEGFGLPVIEAIQSRLPVVACTGSCLEEAGGNATLYVDPDDVYAMAHAIKLTLKGAPGRDERIAEGLQYISRFENNNVAQSVLNVYEELMK